MTLTPQRRYQLRNRALLNTKANEAYARDPAPFRARALRYYRKIDPAVRKIKKQRQRGMPAPTRPEPSHCENCGRAARATARGLHLDHDHATGAFRGWLCNRCNLGLGMLGDTIAAIERMLTYLRRSAQ